MAKDIASKKYPGIYYRELENGDRSYFIITRIAGHQKRISVGKKSEGITEAFCFQQKTNIKNTERFGAEEAAILQRVKKADPTFLEVAEHYLAHGSAKDSSKRLIRSLANSLPFKKQRRVTEADFTSWLADYSKWKKPSTINNRITLIRLIFKHGRAHKLIKYDDPTQATNKLTSDDERLRWLTRDEVDRLLDAVRPNANLYLFTKLALCTGARISTLLLIHDGDIKGNTVQLYNIKTTNRYTGYLDEETVQLLQGRTGYVLAWGDTSRPPSPRWYQAQITKVFDELFNQGVRDDRDRVVIHTLRHTTASLMVQNGTPLHVVQKVLDHKSIKSTERYAKIHQDMVRAEVERLWT